MFCEPGSSHEATINVVWSTNAAGLCESVVEHCAGLLPPMAGLSLQAWIAAVQSGDDGAPALKIEAALAHRQPFACELDIVCHDGARRHALLTGLPRTGADGHPAGYAGALVDVTAQRRALDDAVRSAALNRLIVDSSSDLIGHCDTAGRYVDISSSYTRSMGWTPAQMIGQRVIDFLHPDDQASAQAELEQVFVGGPHPHAVEVRKRDAGGRYVAVGTKARQVTDPATGECVGAVLVSRDISETNLARIALQKSHEQVRTLLESIDDGFFSVNAHWEIVYANTRAAAFVGADRDAAIGKLLWDVAPGLAESSVGAHLRAAMASREGASFEAFYPPVGVWVSERIYAHEDGLSVFFHDISDRVARENRIRQSERRFREMIGITPAGYVLVDADGIVADVNPALCQLSGYARQDLVGQPVASILADGDASEALNLRQTGLHIHALETVLIHQQGHRVYALVNQTIELDADGRPRSLTAFITDITDRKHAEARLEELANRDTLTGLPNRAWINRRVGDMLQQPRDATYTTVFFIDLNRFKEVNDSMGHATGDRLLRQVGERLQSCMRPGDVVARLGGDEFVVAASCAGREAASVIAQRLQHAIQTPFQADGLEMRVGASIGISLAGPGAASTESLFQNADTAMYKAKALGDGSFQFFEPEMCIAAKRRLQLEVSLHRALEGCQFELHYQPRIALHSMQLLGVEALLRWNHPELGRVPPLEFIPLAEERGHIGAIGQWVLGAACRDIRRLNEQFGLALHVSVNVSARQLRSPDLVAQVRRVLAESSLPAGALELELTESALIEDLDQSAEVLRGLKALGVRLSIDDFGTGYSSLSYLKRFPIDVLKLDRSFVAENPAGDGFVRALIDMAHVLDLSVVAEGIENGAAMEALRDAACDEGQGYLFARPMPLRELEAFVVDGGYRLENGAG